MSSCIHLQKSSFETSSNRACQSYGAPELLPAFFDLYLCTCYAVTYNIFVLCGSRIDEHLMSISKGKVESLGDCCQRLPLPRLRSKALEAAVFGVDWVLGRVDFRWFLVAFRVSSGTVMWSGLLSDVFDWLRLSVRKTLEHLSFKLSV